jgi:hypothetical protein
VRDPPAAAAATDLGLEQGKADTRGARGSGEAARDGDVGRF